MTHLSDQSLAQLIEDNVIEYELTLSQKIKDAASHSDSTLTWIAMGLPYDFYNGVYRSVLDGPNVDAQIDSVVAEFQNRHLPMMWHIGPSASPTNLPELLQRHGLYHVEDEPGMVIELGTMNQSIEAPHNLGISLVDTDLDLCKWVSVWAFDASEEVMSDLVDIHRQFGIGGGNPWRYYIGSVEGKPVATSLLFFGEKAAAVHWVVTLPEFKRRGIGAAMTVHALRDARAAGYRHAVLTASPEGVGVYRRLGFHECCTIRRFGWRP